jgi:hypothetical protein
VRTTEACTAALDRGLDEGSTGIPELQLRLEAELLGYLNEADERSTRK